MLSGIKETVKGALGLGPKIRYAVVGLGDITQRSWMPAVKYTSNSEIVALVTSDPKKAENLSKEYNIDKAHTYSYEQFDKLLQDKVCDAIYLATPNWRHEEFAVPALKAGVHVLLEKPMEVSTEKCERILEAQKGTNAKLMIAYRLHFEPATLAAVEKVRSGELGQVHAFSSMFTQLVDPDNHRAKNGWKGGPLFDMGTYPLNAVRKLFDAEPTEVYAVGIRHPEAGLGDLDDTIAVTVTFPQNRIAQFIVSYYGDVCDEYTVSGTKGSIHVAPAFMYDVPLEFAPISIGGKKKHETFKHTEHFAGETEYFSECILKGTDPEPDGREGLADVRVLEAALHSLQSKTPQKLGEYTPRTKPLLPEQEKKVTYHKQPDPETMTHAKPPVKE